MRAALPWWRRRDPNAEVLYWNVRVQLLRNPCPPYHRRWISPMTSPSCLFCVSDSDEACIRGMVEITLVWGGEESLEDPASNVMVCWLVDFTMTEFLSDETGVATCFIVSGHICYTCMELVSSARGRLYDDSGGANRLGHCGGAARSIREMQGVCSTSTRRTSGEGDSATAGTLTGATLTWTSNVAAAQSVAHRSQDRPDRLHHRLIHRRVSRTKVSGGTTMTTRVVPQAVVRVASAVTAVVASTRKVINAHCILTCV